MYSRIRRFGPRVLTGLLAAMVVAALSAVSVSAEALASDGVEMSSSVAWTDELTGEEVAGILYMREEEKLARDVYLTFYQQWGLPIFQNIADSEQTHMEALKTLIDRYGLDDPAAGNDVGTFTDPTLQSLYDELTASGRVSPAAALRVGAAIEEIDIIDLQEHIAETDKMDIVRVYENLMHGSRNHLRAFVSTLERQEGETYQPQYLDQETYDGIIGESVERGGSGGGWQGQGTVNGGRGQGQGTGTRLGRRGSQGGRGAGRW